MATSRGISGEEGAAVLVVRDHQASERASGVGSSVGFGWGTGGRLGVFVLERSATGVAASRPPASGRAEGLEGREPLVPGACCSGQLRPGRKCRAFGLATI